MGNAKTGTAERFLALDSIRGLLACTVVIFHVRGEGYLWATRFFEHGYLAVPFFFVLSGFVIGISYGDRLAKGFPVSRFLALRLGRIYPLHLFMIAVLLIWELVRLASSLPSARHGPPFTGLFDPGLLWYNFALVQKFAGMLSWNDPSWSIGVEWWTYIIFAIFAAYLAYGRMPLLTTALLVLPGAVTRTLNIPLGPGIFETVDCMMNFGFGLLVFQVRGWSLWRLTDHIGPKSGTLLEAVALGMTIGIFVVFGGKLSPLITPIFAFTIAAFSLERGWFSKLLLLGPLVLVGELSYSIYMVHHFILDRMQDLLWYFSEAFGWPVRVVEGNMAVVGNPLLIDLFALAVVAVTIPVSILSYRFIEKPARIWSRRMINPNHSAKVTPPDPTAAF